MYIYYLHNYPRGRLRRKDKKESSRKRRDWEREKGGLKEVKGVGRRKEGAQTKKNIK